MFKSSVNRLIDYQKDAREFEDTHPTWRQIRRDQSAIHAMLVTHERCNQMLQAAVKEWALGRITTDQYMTAVDKIEALAR